MDATTLGREIMQIKDQIHQLVAQELDQEGDPQERYGTARQLAEKLKAYQSQIETLPEKERRMLTELVRQAQPDLNFLEYAANKAAAAPGSTLSAADTIRQFSEEVFSLAKEMLAGKVPLSEAQQKVHKFDDRFREVAKLPGRDDPEMQRLLSEANLELTWIFNGGKGPTSIRLSRFMH